MALLIADDCIDRDICEPESRNEAIFQGEEYCEIDSNKCIASKEITVIEGTQD